MVFITPANHAELHLEQYHRELHAGSHQWRVGLCRLGDDLDQRQALPGQPGFGPDRLYEYRHALGQNFGTTTPYLGYDSSGTTRRFNGVMDEFAIYNQSLTYQQITNLYAAGQCARRLRPPSR